MNKKNIIDISNSINSFPKNKLGITKKNINGIKEIKKLIIIALINSNFTFCLFRKIKRTKRNIIVNNNIKKVIPFINEPNLL